MLETPLDKVEPYGVFKSALFSKPSNLLLSLLRSQSNLVLLELQQEQPQLYDNLTKILNADEQHIVTHVVVRADELLLQAQAQAQAQSSAANVAQFQINGNSH